MPYVWKRLPLSHTAHVHLRRSLCGGQCFRWTMTRFGTFVGVVQNRAYELRPVKLDVRGNGAVEFRCLATKSAKGPATKRTRSGPSPSEPDDAVVLSCYLALDVDLAEQWPRWVSENPHQAHALVQFFLKGVDRSATPRAAPAQTNSDDDADTTADVAVTLEYFPPVHMMRLLRQDVHQTVYEFLCSQNNHMTRITALVQKLCVACGDHICDYNLQSGDVVNGKRRLPADSAEDPEILSLYTFPTVDQLAALSETALRELGFGYRAKYIVGTTALIKAARAVPTAPSTKPEARLLRSGWAQHGDSDQEPFYHALLSLRGGDGTTDTTAQQAMRAQLLTLPGVGRKVADCILLFALDQHDLVPVDTHMVQAAIQYLAPTNTSTGSTAGRKRPRAASVGATTGPQWEAVLLAWKAKQTTAAAKVKPTKAGKHARSHAAASTDKVARASIPALQDAQHDAIQEGFRTLFGPYCGWAHSNIFYFMSSAS